MECNDHLGFDIIPFHLLWIIEKNQFDRLLARRGSKDWDQAMGGVFTDRGWQRRAMHTIPLVLGRWHFVEKATTHGRTAD
jgi:hypothetical protein